jgi:hypothetical protein
MPIFPFNAGSSAFFVASSPLANGEPAMTSDKSYTVNEFCTAERLSRGMLYKLWEAGKGPRFFYIGNSRRISHQARIEWRERLEGEAAASNNPTPPEVA